jgi:hypothetical protein
MLASSPAGLSVPIDRHPPLIALVYLGVCGEGWLPVSLAPPVVDESTFFEWRRDHHVNSGQDVWIGHGTSCPKLVPFGITPDEGLQARGLWLNKKLLGSALLNDLA